MANVMTDFEVVETFTPCDCGDDCNGIEAKGLSPANKQILDLLVTSFKHNRQAGFTIGLQARNHLQDLGHEAYMQAVKLR